MIQSFKDERCSLIFRGEEPGRRFPPALRRVTFRKLRALDRAAALEDLRHPNGNHLEALTDDRLGQHSVRVNDQFRICFRWTDDGPADVEFVDYHR